MGAIAEIVVTKTGTSTVAAVGDEILVQLPENATTGYQWSVERVSGPLEVVSSELALPGAGPGVAPVGAGGQRLVRLAVVAPGLGAAELVLSRSWETSSLERFEVEVRAEPASS
ncbi:protease inhibitor I42 family protein [Actinopolymorpha sp. NPDC004070]|uniref:protease inhibitor I42 family protein n=1 Tax=Actinopolymorpha sp. NPDC004070 TaxID=3154548 RepID=UPI0033ACB960